METSDRPAVFVLGGAKISDAFGMMEKVLKDGSADTILACGITGEIFLMAKGFSLGKTKEAFIRSRSLDLFIDDAKRFLQLYGERILMPSDLAYELSGKRKEISVTDLPLDEMFLDIGSQTIDLFSYTQH